VKRAITILGFLLGSVALFAQVHGPGASVLSSGGGATGIGKSMITGPAASVLSTGPYGWSPGVCSVTPCVNPNFTATVNYQTGTVHLGQRFNTGSGGRKGHHRPSGGYGYAYAYPVYVPVEVEPEPEEEQPEPPAPTVFERRSQVRLAPNPTPVGDESRYGEHYLDQREQPAEAVAAPSPGKHNMSPVSDEQIPVLIIYKDGREQEIQNYAIVGDTLYDLGTFVAHKIKLADVDVKQTIEKNEQRGVEFTVPESYKPVG
jgi:hypothetical protein